MHTFRTFVDSFEIDEPRAERLISVLSCDSPFIFQRYEKGARKPRFTYVGLSVADLEEERMHGLGSEPALTEPQDEAMLSGLPFRGGAFCYLPYSYPETSTGAAALWFVRKFLAIDHEKGRAFLVEIQTQDTASDIEKIRAGLGTWIAEHAALSHVSAPAESGFGDSADWICDVDYEEYSKRLNRIQQAIAAGSLRQAILSIGLSRKSAASPAAVFSALRKRSPSSHTFLINQPDLSIIGASPAMHLFKLGDLLTVETDAGTRAVGKDEAETSRIVDELLSSHKDIEEQKMIVEETVADLARIALSGRVDKPVALEVRRQGQVMHLYTVLEAELGKGIDSFDAVLSSFPPAAVTGSPKAAAMQLIKEVEGKDRGPYAGIFGLLGFDGSVDTALILRSAWISNGEAAMRCGGGITADSVAEDEFRECMNKARTMIDAFAAAERG